jgi:DeoR family transcriptional regulator, fructose operon transcriptional repressor
MWSEGGEREAAILAALREEGFVRIPSLAVRLGVSESTVRRSLQRLEQQGKIHRAVGGAVPNGAPSGTAAVQAFDERRRVALEEKVALAREAARLVRDGDTVFLAGGSTVGQMPRFLRGRPLQVVTNSLAIAAEFEDWPATEVLVTGGYLFPRHRLLSGPVTLETLRSFHFTWAFISGAAFTAAEVTDWNMMMAEVNREALQRAERGVALLDGTKFNRRHLARVCSLSELDFLVTGTLPPDDRQRLAAEGGGCAVVEVNAAGEEPGGEPAEPGPGSGSPAG